LFTEQQIEKLAPKQSAFKAGKKLAVATKWDILQTSQRAIWGHIKGSGKNHYIVQIDTANLAYKCTCPSRQFPCKHALGLLLVLNQDQTSFKETKEPDYVEEWLNKRAKRAEKVEKEEKEITEEEKGKRTAAKVKRQDDRMKLTLAGVAELKLWLMDMIRIGILELPNRRPAYFDSMAERMVDAKASGLAGWVKALKNLPYKEQHLWQSQAMSIISKLYLLVKAAENLEQYEIQEQRAIKGTLGWTYNQKELLADDSSISMKDQWLVLGSHSEEQEDLTILRYWLYGLDSEKDAIIIRFQSNFTATEKIPIVEGSIAEAELTFYPGLESHRAFIKKQKELSHILEKQPEALDNWTKYKSKQIGLLQKNPWFNNHADIINDINITKGATSLLAVDCNNQYQKISAQLDEDRTSTLLLTAIDKSINLAFVQKQDGILPLGFFSDNKYQVL